MERLGEDTFGEQWSGGRWIGGLEPDRADRRRGIEFAATAETEPPVLVGCDREFGR